MRCDLGGLNVIIYKLLHGGVRSNAAKVAVDSGASWVEGWQEKHDPSINERGVHANPTYE